MYQKQFSWVRWMLAFVLVIVAMFVTEVSVVADDDEPFESNQVVVKLNPATNTTIEEINTTYGTTTLNSLLSSRNIYLLQTPANNSNGGGGDDADDNPFGTIIEQMQDDPSLLYAEPNYTGAPPENGGRDRVAWGGSDPAPYNTQYATQMLKLAEVHTVSRGISSIVAVLDTGFQLDHPALAGNLTSARYDFVDDDAEPTEDFANLDTNGDGVVDDIAGHGTHVATTLLLVAPDAQIMPIRVLDANGRGNVFLIAEAVDFAVQNGAHVINMSLVLLCIK
ncbi:S8 family serine peptidase [Chloroflexi bacterium TSY]|nr:S8 family serine peptidase [Chloroflexi bacterium TSY]